MGIRSSGCAAVDAMDRIRIVGNVIPQSWYREILRDNGKPYLLAVTLLSDIVYWYRPIEERDEASGYVTGLRKRFRGDLLQKTYEEYAVLYGESKRTIKAALDRLEELGLIRKIFRDIKLKNGTKIPNVMYIEIFPDRIEEISHYDINPPASGPTVQKLDNEEPETPVPEPCLSTQSADPAGPEGGGTKFCMTPYKILYDPLQNNVPYPTQDCTHVLQNNVPYPTQDCTHVLQNFGGYPTPNGGTNTENTTENTPGNTSGTTGETKAENTADLSRGESSPVQSCQEAARDSSGNGEGDARSAFAEPVRVPAQEKADRRTDRELYLGFLRDQVQYARILQEDTYGDAVNIVDGILSIIADIATTEPPDGYERVNGRQYPHEVVKSRLLKMDYETIMHVLERFKENKTEIRNVRSYLLTALYNARDEKDIQFQNYFNHSYYGMDWQRKED